MSDPDFTSLPDLASRLLGGGVVAASDELFAEKENLVTPGRAGLRRGGVRPPGQGLRRLGDRGAGARAGTTRRSCGSGCQGSCTAWSSTRRTSAATTRRRSRWRRSGPRGTRPRANWPGWTGRRSCPRRRCQGDTANAYQVADRRRWTHVRLSIYPDGGVARFRVHGTAAARPALPDRHRRPGGHGARRPGGRLLGRVLRLGVQPDPARPAAASARGGRTRGGADPATTT